ncbi:MAG: hypothetical protein C4524_00750 [Candidatus Zixiibacteriota bacterium]|nr:MAG: hypothetical protein C4524_00750 [candidate division Zixibacteria bacterium]
MAEIYNINDAAGPDEVNVEVILKRIFSEPDPAAHRAAIWELLGRTDDWELFERIEAQGGQKSIENYFRALLENFDQGAGDYDFDTETARDEVRELYAAPIICMHNADWAGTAAAMHEILLNEIYSLYPVSENELPFGEATALGLKKWVGEEALFPLSIIEFMAFSDYLTEGFNPDLLEGNLALLLTLFFSAQAYMDLREGGDNLVIYPDEDE